MNQKNDRLIAMKSNYIRKRSWWTARFRPKYGWRDSEMPSKSC